MNGFYNLYKATSPEKNSTLYDGTSLFRRLQAVLAKQVSRTWYVSSTSASRPGCGDRNTMGPTFVLSLIFWEGEYTTVWDQTQPICA